MRKTILHSTFLFLLGFVSFAIAQTNQMPARQIGSILVDTHTSAPLQLAREVELDVSVERLWAYISESESMVDYFPNVSKVSLNPDGSERALTLGDGTSITEKIVVRDEDSHALGWILEKGNPMGLTNHLGVVSIREADARSGAILTWSYFFEHENSELMQNQIGSLFDGVNANLIDRFGGDVTGLQYGFADAVITQSRVVYKSREEVWKVVAEDFDRADQWSSNIASIESEAGPNGERIGEIRACFIPSLNGATREIITAYDEDEGSFSYVIEVGLPPFATLGENEWTVSEIDANTTLVTSTFNISTAPGTPSHAIAFARDKFNLALSMGLDEVKFFIEQGHPHPRKIASVQ